MKLYIETLFKPNTSCLGKPKKETQHIIVCEEGIIYHGETDQKLVIHNDPTHLSQETPPTYSLSNIKLVEDTTKTSLIPVYNIPINHHMMILHREIYSIKNIRFVIEYHNQQLYNLYFENYDRIKDLDLIENTLKKALMKS